MEADTLLVEADQPQVGHQRGRSVYFSDVSSEVGHQKEECAAGGNPGKAGTGSLAASKDMSTMPDTGHEESPDIALAPPGLKLAITSSVSSSSSSDEPVSLQSPVVFPGDNKGKVLRSTDQKMVQLASGSSGDDFDTLFNPFKNNSSIRRGADEATKALSCTSAAELTIECRDLTRMEMFARNNVFVTLMSQGMEPGTWEEMYRTETVQDTRSPNFIRKFRLPASTVEDRETQYQLHVYNCQLNCDSTSPLSGMELIGTTQTTVAELLAVTQMTTENVVLSPRSGRRKGSAFLTLDMIDHEEQVEETTFDFGFTEDAPVRNRIFFVVSRSIQKGRFSPIYKSEVKVKEDLSKFEDVTLSSQELHGGDQGRLFRIEIYRFYLNGTTTLLGFVQTSLEKLKQCEPGAQLYWWPSMRGFTRVGFRIIRSKLDEKSGKNWFVLRLTK